MALGKHFIKNCILCKWFTDNFSLNTIKIHMIGSISEAGTMSCLKNAFKSAAFRLGLYNKSLIQSKP
jgi:hypothetical protein